MRTHRPGAPDHVVEPHWGWFGEKSRRRDGPGPLVCRGGRRTLGAHIDLIGWRDQATGLELRQVGVKPGVQPSTANLDAVGLHHAAGARERQRADEPSERLVRIAALSGLLGDQPCERRTRIDERGTRRGGHHANRIPARDPWRAAHIIPSGPAVAAASTRFPSAILWRTRWIWIAPSRDQNVCVPECPLS